VAHACNPSYSGGRDQENLDSKPGRANSSQDPVLKIPNTKRTSGVAQSVGPEFKPQYCKTTTTKRHFAFCPPFCLEAQKPTGDDEDEDKGHHIQDGIVVDRSPEYQGTTLTAASLSCSQI
jgi:hypothetical protein